MTRLEVEEQPAETDVRFLEEQINEFNMAITGLRDARELAIFLRDEQGLIVGGLAGHTWGGYCEVRLLWVHESARGRGYGAALLTAAEEEVRSRGCDRVVLSTHTFQAPAFYEKQGYSVFGRADGFPRGHAWVTLQKVLR